MVEKTGKYTEASYKESKEKIELIKKEIAKTEHEFKEKEDKYVKVGGEYHFAERTYNELAKKLEEVGKKYTDDRYGFRPTEEYEEILHEHNNARDRYIEVKKTYDKVTKDYENVVAKLDELRDKERQQDNLRHEILNNMESPGVIKKLKRVFFNK